MELGGKVTIECEKTGYRVELEFKLKVRCISFFSEKTFVKQSAMLE